MADPIIKSERSVKYVVRAVVNASDNNGTIARTEQAGAGNVYDSFLEAQAAALKWAANGKRYKVMKVELVGTAGPATPPVEWQWAVE